MKNIKGGLRPNINILEWIQLTVSQNFAQMLKKR